MQQFLPLLIERLAIPVGGAGLLVGALLAAGLFAVTLGVRAFARRPLLGVSGLIGEVGVARGALAQLMFDYYSLRTKATSAMQASQAVDEAILRFSVMHAAQNQVTMLVGTDGKRRDSSE